MLTKKTNTAVGLLEFTCGILSVLFWILLMFGFEEKSIALATLTSALIHEMGHIIYLLIGSKSPLHLRGVESGFRIKSSHRLSYKQQRLLYLSGPLSNIAVCVFCLCFSPVFGVFAFFFGIINLMTALTNLLPIEGYDGYGAIKSYLEEMELPYIFQRVLSIISTSLIFIFCIFSLYLMDRLDGGYWFFGIFSFTMIKHMERSLSKQ